MSTGSRRARDVLDWIAWHEHIAAIHRHQLPGPIGWLVLRTGLTGSAAARRGLLVFIEMSGQQPRRLLAALAGKPQP